MERVHQLLVWVKKAPIPAFVQIKITEATIMRSYLKPLAAVVVGSDNSNSNSKKKDNSKTKEKKDLTDDDITELMRDFGRALCWTDAWYYIYESIVYIYLYYIILCTVSK